MVFAPHACPPSLPLSLSPPPQVPHLSPDGARSSSSGPTRQSVSARQREAEELEALGRFQEAAELYKANLQARCSAPLRAALRQDLFK